MVIKNYFLTKKTNSNIFTLQTDENEYILHSDIIVKYGITKGSVVSAGNMNKYAFESEVIIATNLAIKYLSSRLKTTKQLQTYLAKKGFSNESINCAIQKLSEYKILDDKNYANVFTRTYQNTKSKNYMKNKLYTDGVNKNLIDESMQNIDDYYACAKAGEKYLKNKTLDKKNLQKLIAHLQYKGFEYDTILKVLKNYKSSIED